MIDVHGVLLLSTPAYYIFSCLASALALFFLMAMFRRWRRARWLEDTPTSRIRSAAQGLVELQGTLDAGGHEPLISPLGEVDCLWYRFVVEEYQRTGKNKEWRTVEKGESERPFLLRDDTGSCWIKPKGADVHPRQRRRWEGSQRWPAGRNVRTGFLAGLLGSRYRYTEEWFSEGEMLYALGWFESRGGGREAIDQQAIARQVISGWKADYDDLLARFDRNADGQIDLQEWQQVRAAAGREAERLARVEGRQPVVHVLAKPARYGLPFILSDHHEEDLSRRMRRGAVWCMLGLGVSMPLACWFWLA
ncbi:GIDE domain-containing protein [Halopseudomonas maritima]|uniref:GIDE domain-containing protein n=1 Tax=Halopseudomonas maritima TaxID=2918528 RepID=UPI001EEBCF6B|nr:GIDE domain-containing protein [Halopseudomonas maritima]UJJ31044.1 hypothetical protein HV822_14940 [Halopseudomonas maritima]